MKTTTFAVALLGLFPAVLAAETLAPSPTESIGCEPHGDHWHCEAARTTLATAKAPATTDEEDHDDHEAGESESLAPSPTESVGCEPHGDHWHCEAARTSGGAAADAVTSESIAPSPTESVGCEPHGDHWHCEGPATGAASGTAASGTPTSSGEVTVTNAAGIQMVPVVGLFAAAVLAL
ncbi:hypothetical protein CEP54_003018 [Fusarium duplospermum]|uniref:Uncharacterized protein n=1 Tax=Fusarium duplospermum TaxID=1325734 RepID=A0A428QRL3_9HYPO|nr:hypothetical protein CEP54_003018 [Fusarium duplospermum]